MAFTSLAADLVDDDSNSQPDVFVRDRLDGTTERVSVADDGSQANGPSYEASISADGRFVVFVSHADNLVSDDSNAMADVFVRDRVDGVTELVSLSSSGAQANGSSYEVSISSDGGFVAFISSATNLVAGDTYANQDVFVHDRSSGATRRVSIASDHTESVTASSSPAISQGGRFVAFRSLAANLVTGDYNGAWDVFVRDTLLWSTERISVSSAGLEADGHSITTAMTPDGQHIAFTSHATNLVGDDTNEQSDIYLRRQVVIEPIFYYLPLILR